MLKILGLTPTHYPEAVKNLQDKLASLTMATQCRKCKRFHQVTPAEHATLCPAFLHIDRVKTWNTGREYSAFGQRIAAISYEGSTVFVDFDRHINGVIGHHCNTISFMKDYVMTAYDLNTYTPPETPNQLKAIRFIQDNKEELLK